MDPLFLVGIAGLLGGLVLAALNGARGKRADPVAGQPPPQQLGTTQRLRETVSAAAGGRVSRVASYRDPAGSESVETGVQFCVSGLDPSIDITRATGLGAARGRTGDPEFDAVVSVGEPAAVLALLDAECRAALRGLLLGSVRISQFWIEGGELTAHVPTDGFAREHPGLHQVAHAIGSVAARLGAPRDVVAMLAQNAAHDPQPGVRLRNLEVLVTDFTKDPRTRVAARQALGDASPHVRLKAATALGSEGQAVLVALALDPAPEDELSARAIEALGDGLPLDRIEPLIQAASQAKHRAATTRAFIGALGGNASPLASDTLARLARTCADTFGPDVVAAFVALPRPNAERVLIDLLGSLSSGRLLAEATARALADVGTADAVLPLKEAAERFRGTVSDVARRSMAAIRSRLAGTPGELALAGDQDGQVSLATDEAGRVSLRADDPDRDP